MSSPSFDLSMFPPPCEAREARSLWLNRARAYQAHVRDCPECRWEAVCPIEAELNVLCAEAWDALDAELDEERPSGALTALVVAAVCAAWMAALVLAALWMVGRI